MKFKVYPLFAAVIALATIATPSLVKADSPSSESSPAMTQLAHRSRFGLLT